VLNQSDYAPKTAFRPSTFLPEKKLPKFEKKSENLEFYGFFSGNPGCAQRGGGWVGARAIRIAPLATRFQVNVRLPPAR
jgi:hypothetical protein